MNANTRARDAVLLAVLALFQLLLWQAFFWREIAWHQPEYYDQSNWLLASYRLEQAVLQQGPGAILTYLQTKAPFSGLLLAVEGTLVALFTGGERLPRLAVNFAFALAVQLTVFLTVRRLGGRSAHGFAALGLMLCLLSPWSLAGGMFDFRMDFSAACLFGIWACCAVASGGLQQRRGAALALALALAMLGQRLVATAYLLGIYAGWAVLCGAAALNLRRRPALAPAFRQRALHALASLAVLGLGLAIILAWRWDAFREYYVEGHLLGEERLARAREQGVFTLLDHLTYYPLSLARTHLGRGFGLGAGLVLLAALAWARRPPLAALVALGPVLLALVLPLVVLTMDVSKSPVVAGVMTVPLVLATVLLAAAVARPGSALVRVAAVVLVLLGGWQTFARASRHSLFDAQRPDLTQLAELDGWLVREARAQGWPALFISADVMTAWFNADAVAAMAYERTGDLLPVNMLLGSRVDAITPAEVEALLAASNVLVLSSRAGQGELPFDRSMAGMAAKLRQLAARDWVLVRSLALSDNTLEVFLRPAAVAQRGGRP